MIRHVEAGIGGIRALERLPAAEVIWNLADPGVPPVEAPKLDQFGNVLFERRPKVNPVLPKAVWSLSGTTPTGTKFRMRLVCHDPVGNPKTHLVLEADLPQGSHHWSISSDPNAKQHQEVHARGQVHPGPTRKLESDERLALRRFFRDMAANDFVLPVRQEGGTITEADAIFQKNARAQIIAWLKSV